MADKKGGRSKKGSTKSGSSPKRGGRSRSSKSRPSAKPKTPAKRTNKRPSARAKSSARTKARKKPAGLTSRTWFRLSVVGAAVIVAVGVFFLLWEIYAPRRRTMPPGASKPSPPPGRRAEYRPPLYEEPTSSPGGKVRSRLEVALYQALLDSGAGHDDIHYRLDAGPGPIRMTVRLRSGVNPKVVEARFRRRLKTPGLTASFKAVGPDKIVARIYLRRRLTHRISFHMAARPAPGPRSGPTKATTPGTTRPLGGPAGKRPKVAIIIDDVGYLWRLGRDLVDLDLPLAVSVLPYTRYGVRLARRAHARGKVVMVHLPMQPRSRSGADPGPGSLKANMDDKTLVKLIRRALARVPHAVGVNNHMGSLFTRKRAKMKIVLRELRHRGLFFVDSWTSGASVGFHLARRMCLRTAVRTVFIDHHPDSRYVAMQLIKLVAEARRRGEAIAIGHPHPATYAVLKVYRDYLRRNVRLVPITELVHRRPGCRPGTPSR
ncbi:MAG: divergent polysaccharide deacetylase family protein [Proteobacteria bacterium]|nr:divergent polysaccharide deacetylase family protein [Pseudomonadota bacterium]MBU1742847.1 divergent polysaccharide deacetylase family protein [Pseudomonadota bacterium]